MERLILKRLSSDTLPPFVEHFKEDSVDSGTDVSEVGLKLDAEEGHQTSDDHVIVEFTLGDERCAGSESVCNVGSSESVCNERGNDSAFKTGDSTRTVCDEKG